MGTPLLVLPCPLRGSGFSELVFPELKGFLEGEALGLARDWDALGDQSLATEELPQVIPQVSKPNKPAWTGCPTPDTPGWGQR